MDDVYHCVKFQIIKHSIHTWNITTTLDGIAIKYSAVYANQVGVVLHVKNVYVPKVEILCCKQKISLRCS